MNPLTFLDEIVQRNYEKSIHFLGLNKEVS